MNIRNFRIPDPSFKWAIRSAYHNFSCGVHPNILTAEPTVHIIVVAGSAHQYWAPNISTVQNRYSRLRALLGDKKLFFITVRDLLRITAPLRIIMTRSAHHYRYWGLSTSLISKQQFCKIYANITTEHGNQFSITNEGEQVQIAMLDAHAIFVPRSTCGYR